MSGSLPDSAAAALRAAAVLWRHAGTLQDSLQSPHQSLVDSVVVKSPLPGPLVPIVQWFFQKPGWLMLAGIIVGAIVAVIALVWLWRRRQPLWHWLATRDRAIKLALGTVLALLLALVGAAGFKSYHFMMHDNSFCQGCHVFVPSGRIVTRPDTGTYLPVRALEGKHDTLSCHACHPFESPG